MIPETRTEEEARLGFFVGDWTNSGQVAPGAFGPGGPTSGETRYRWDVGGKWLLYQSHLELPGLGEYEVRGGIAHNARAGNYDAFAVNNLGNLLVYRGAWTDETTLVFALVYPPSDSPARVVYRKLPDGSFTMASETAAENGEFVAYFQTDFVRT
jgi:hypothetical protein